MRFRYAVVTGISVLILGFALTTIGALSTHQREGNFQTMIHTLLAGDDLVLFVFQTPLSSGQTILTTDDATVEVGEDYVCFGEPWNEGVRQQCTPFSNITSITFVESP